MSGVEIEDVYVVLERDGVLFVHEYGFADGYGVFECEGNTGILISCGFGEIVGEEYFAWWWLPGYEWWSCGSHG